VRKEFWCGNLFENVNLHVYDEEIYFDNIRMDLSYIGCRMGGGADGVRWQALVLAVINLRVLTFTVLSHKLLILVYDLSL
jgi:hypothetical protein